MQRNMDLVRLILMRIEDSYSGWSTPPFGLQGLAPETIRYQAHIMTEDGLLEGADVPNLRGTDPEAMPLALTAKGHDFLDLARDQTRWNQAHLIIRKVGSAPIAVWMKVLKDLLLKELGVAS
jgi:hypothetical protein